MVNRRPTRVLHSNLTPSRLQIVDLGVDHRVGQAEIGNAVFQHAARLVEGLVDGDVAAGLGHVGRAGHAGRPGADDADLEPVRLDIGNVDPALLDGGVADEALQPADRDRFERFADRAHAFALVLLRTDPAANRRQQIGVGEDVVGAAEILLGRFLDEAGDVDSHRAAGDAGFVRTHQAALGFAQRVLQAVTAGDLLEILGPRLRVLLAHRRAFLRNVLIVFFFAISIFPWRLS
jgi:hypothetical protein